MSKRIAGWSLGARACALIYCSTFVMAAAPAGSSVSFAYPPAPTVGSLTVNTIDSVYAEWTSSYADAWLYIYCNTGPNAGTETIFHQAVNSSGNMMISLGGQGPLESKSDWPTPLRCWFDLNYADKGGQGIGALVVSVTSIATDATTYSPGFAQATIGSAAPSPSTASTASSAATTTAAGQANASEVSAAENAANTTNPSATGSQASATNAQPTTASTSTATNPHASSGIAAASTSTTLSPGTAAGIAIGALVGVGAIAAIAVLLYRRHRKQRNQGQHPGQNYGNEAQKYGNEAKPYGVTVANIQQYHEPASRYEMQGTQPQELSALTSAKGSLKAKRY